MTSEVQAIIFDLDGTLIDSMGGFYNLVIKNLMKRGITIQKKDMNRIGNELLEEYQSTPSKQGLTLVFKLFWTIGRKLGLSRTKALIFTIECLKKARKVYYSAPLFPDVKSSLFQLKKAGFELGICTLASKRQLQETLNKHELIHLFNPNALISRNDVKRVKPDPEGILLALKGCSANPPYGVYLGDMPVDIIAGNRAGITTIGLTTGLINKEVLQIHSNPTKIFESLMEASCWILKTDYIER